MLRLHFPAASEPLFSIAWQEGIPHTNLSIRSQSMPRIHCIRHERAVGHARRNRY